MIPRGRLDLPWSDFLRAISHCLMTNLAGKESGATLAAHWPGRSVLPTLSIRSGWDCWLASQGWAAGDEILVSDVTIPDMVRIIAEHGLRAVPVPVDFDTLSVSAAEVAARLTSRTRALLVAHLFGSRMPLEELVQLSRARGVLLVEDAAQAFTNVSTIGHPESDLVLLSFGPIKTQTALGGGLLLFRDREQAERCAVQYEQTPVASNGEFLHRVLKLAAVQAGTWPPAFTLLQSAMSALGADPDRILSSLTRGFHGADFWRRLRRQPSPALQAFLADRLRHCDEGRIQSRRARAECLWSQMPEIDRPGRQAVDHSHWVWPIVADDPPRCCAGLRRKGFDATTLGSSLVRIGAGADASDRWRRLVYLPQHPAVKLELLTKAVHELQGL